MRPTASTLWLNARVAFGSGYVGDQLAASLFLEAHGDAKLRIMAIVADSASLAVELTDPILVMPGAAQIVIIRWTVEQPGELHALLGVQIEGVPTPEPVPVTGYGLAIPSCDDQNPCTADRFDRSTDACQHSDVTGPCDDSNACTTDDTCVAGLCRGAALDCDDGVVCTLDLCDATTGCTFLPEDGRCDDDDPCTADVCDAVSGCGHPKAPDGTACLPPISGPECSLGRCGTPTEFECNVIHLCWAGECTSMLLAPGQSICPVDPYLEDPTYCEIDSDCQNCLPAIHACCDQLNDYPWGGFPSYNIYHPCESCCTCADTCFGQYNATGAECVNNQCVHQLGNIFGGPPCSPANPGGLCLPGFVCVTGVCTLPPGCTGDSPAGCAAGGAPCPPGTVCDPSAGCNSSDCVCDTMTGTWICTDDCGGGECVL